MEVPNLSSSSICCLENEVSVVDKIEISVRLHLRHNIEISFNIKSEVFVEFSLSWFSLPFISVDNVPLLPETILLFIDANVSVFSINITLDFQDLSFLVDN
jgi:hypothetical protein